MKEKTEQKIEGKKMPLKLQDDLNLTCINKAGK